MLAYLTYLPDIQAYQLFEQKITSDYEEFLLIIRCTSNPLIDNNALLNLSWTLINDQWKFVFFQIFGDCSCVSGETAPQESFLLPKSLVESESTTLSEKFTTLKVTIKKERQNRNTNFSTIAECSNGWNCERWFVSNKLPERVLHVPGSHVLHQIFRRNRTSLKLLSFSEMCWRTR